jgi:hypothetical protein
MQNFSIGKCLLIFGNTRYTEMSIFPVKNWFIPLGGIDDEDDNNMYCSVVLGGNEKDADSNQSAPMFYHVSPEEESEILGQETNCNPLLSGKL